MSLTLVEINNVLNHLCSDREQLLEFEQDYVTPSTRRKPCAKHEFYRVKKIFTSQADFVDFIENPIAYSNNKKATQR